jgi:hypothetical protein
MRLEEALSSGPLAPLSGADAMRAGDYALLSLTAMGKHPGALGQVDTAGIGTEVIRVAVS